MYLPPLCFPFFELRQGRPDRRSGSERRVNSRLVDHDRRHAVERRIRAMRRQRTLDRTQLLQGMRFPVSQDTESRRMKYTRIFLTPAAIALGTAAITYFINQQQIESADLMAEKQIESAEIIARSQLDNSRRIADARLSTEKLDQMIDMYSQIINQLAGSGKEDDPGPAALKQRIASFEVYRDDALPFLIQLRDYRREAETPADRGSQDLYDVASDEARATILRIVRESQPDLAGQSYLGSDGKQLNLRHRRYSGFNMSDSLFRDVNLFNADFTEATLTGSVFQNVDLVNADFAGANLQEVEFQNVNLRGVNFRGAFLRDAKFDDVKGIGEANFSAHVLLRANAVPSSLIPEDQLTTALVPYIRQVNDIHRKGEVGAEHFDTLYDRLKVSDFEALVTALEKRKASLETIDDQENKR